MEFLVLGPLEVPDDGETVHVGGRGLRALLAILATRANEVVPASVFIESIWANADIPKRPCSAR